MRRLLDRGDEVVCVDNLVTGSAEHVGRPGRERRFCLVEADVSIDVPVAGPFDAVINLACPASPADFEPFALQILDVGSRGVRNLLELARAIGPPSFRHPPARSMATPWSIPSRRLLGQRQPVGPRSVYDEAKRFGEALTMAYHHRHGLEVRMARIFNTYGPGMRPDDGRLVSNFVTQALCDEPLTIHGDGAQTRSLCFVDDEVSGRWRCWSPTTAVRSTWEAPTRSPCFAWPS